MFGRYQQFLLLAHLREDKNCRWCPNPSCAAPIIGNTNDSDFPKLTCNQCFTEFCFHCSQKVNFLHFLTCVCILLTFVIIVAS